MCKTSPTVPVGAKELTALLVKARSLMISIYGNEWSDNMTYIECLENLEDCIVSTAIMATQDASETKTEQFLRDCEYDGPAF